jgi:hypothetical protein
LLEFFRAIKKKLVFSRFRRHGEIRIDETSIGVIPDNCSPVRYIVSQAHGETYKPLSNLNEAKKTENAVVILEGDWGGQIYLTCSLKLVHCDEQSLIELLDYLDQIAWDCNEGEGKGIYYEVKNPGEGISGGMGGGIVLNELWVHREFESIKSKIQNVIDGKSARIE